MPSPKQIKGGLSESLARSFLEKQSYKFLDRNWHCRHGEIDLIMKDQDELVFVEVKMRASDEFGHPENMISYSKINKLKKTALTYIETRKFRKSFWRFDTIAITGNNLNYEIVHFRDSIRVDY